MGSQAVVASRRNCGVTLFCSSQLCSVWASYWEALAAAHGASTGTSVDIWSSWVTTVARSGRITGSSGAEPVGELSLNVERRPSER
jgi:hypothetical protein